MFTLILYILKRILLVIFVMTIFLIAFLFKGEVQSIVPRKIKEKYKLQVKEINKRKVFTLSPKEDRKTDKVILYLHGGSYVGALNNEHWDFLSDIVNDTGITIVIPDYPLTPKYNYKDAFNVVEPVYKEILKNKENKKIIIMGDSAGGGMALALVQKMNQENVELPDKTILLSPWLDVTMKNSDISKIEENDPILSKKALIISGEHYSGRDGKESYLVNPINGPLEGLRDIIIFTGTYDMLNADAKLLVAKANKLNINIEIREYEEAVHIWMLSRHNKKIAYKAEEAYQEIITLLKEV